MLMEGGLEVRGSLLLSNNICIDGKECYISANIYTLDASVGLGEQSDHTDKISGPRSKT
jgi:hypothetical protein